MKRFLLAVSAVAMVGAGAVATAMPAAAVPVATENHVEFLATSVTPDRWTGGTFSVSCPESAPYVKRYTTDAYGGTSARNELSEGYINPGGVRIWENGSIAISTHINLDTKRTARFDGGTHVAYAGVVGDYFNYRTIFRGHSGHFTITLQCVANMKDGASQRIS